jgi:hypothetical protein
VASAGALAADSEEEEPVTDPHQRLTRLPLDALSLVSAFAVVVHWPEPLADPAGVSTAGAADAWAFEPCDSGVTEVEKAAIDAAPSAEPPPSATS